MKKRPPPPALASLTASRPTRPMPPAPVPSEDRAPIRWLLDLLSRDLMTARPGERRDLSEDMFRLLVTRDGAIAFTSVTPPDGYTIDAKRKSEGPDWPWADVVLLTLQAALRTGIARLDAGQTWEPFAKSPLVPFYERKEGTLVRRFHGTYDVELLAAALDVLVRWWPQLRQCRHCHARFLPKEARQWFHAPACSAAARAARFARNLQVEKERHVLRTGPGRGSKGRKKR